MERWKVTYRVPSGMRYSVKHSYGEAYLEWLRILRTHNPLWTALARDSR